MVKDEWPETTVLSSTSIVCAVVEISMVRVD
jgi:hypothetical protein